MFTQRQQSDENICYFAKWSEIDEIRKAGGTKEDVFGSTVVWQGDVAKRGVWAELWPGTVHLKENTASVKNIHIFLTVSSGSLKLLAVFACKQIPTRDHVNRPLCLKGFLNENKKDLLLGRISGRGAGETRWQKMCYFYIARYIVL